MATETESSDKQRRCNLATALCLYVFLFAVYFITYSGVVVSTDERGMLSAVESLVKRGNLTMDQIYWYGYSVGTFEPAQILLAAPLYWIALLLPQLGGLQTVYLFNLFVTAATGGLVFLYMKRLGYDQAVSTVVALLFGLATMAWVYTKFFFREPLAGLFLLASFYFLLALHPGYRASHWIRGTQVVLAAGAFVLTVATKETNVIALPIFLVIAGLYLVEGGLFKQLRTIVILFIAMAAFFTLLLMYNWQLIGRISIGARNVLDGLKEWYAIPPEAWQVMPQMLVSPGKGLFTHSPILLVGLFSTALLLHRRRYAEALLPIALILVYMRAYAQIWWVWWGGLAWGPRYFVPILPLLAIATGPVVELVLQRRSRGLIATFASVVILSLLSQIGGVAVNLLLFSEELARTGIEGISWTLAIYDPRYSEITGHLRLLLRLKTLDFAWVRYVDGRLSLDLLPPALAVSVAIMMAYLLWRFQWRVPSVTTMRILGAAALLVPVILAGICLPRYYDDPHYRREKEWFKLINHLEAKERPGDVLILNHVLILNLPTHADFFLNYSKAFLPWYGLEKEKWPPQKASAILPALLHSYKRIWLATEFYPEADEFRGVERWLDEHAYKIQDIQFGYPARLMLFITSTMPQPKLTTLSPLALFGEGIEFLGVQYITSTLQAGDVLPVTLYWRARQPLTVDYSVTLQLLDNQGRLRAQIDRYPVDNFRPTTSWRAGEIIRDNYGLVLPSDLPPGYYRLAVAFYEWRTQKRLPLFASQPLVYGQDMLFLGEIAVGILAPPLP